jgi:hypothetical protein
MASPGALPCGLLLLQMAHAAPATYEQAMDAMDGEVNGDLMQAWDMDIYDLQPKSKGFLAEDYFDSGLEEVQMVKKPSPTFTEQVKKALQESAKKNNPGVAVKPVGRQEQVEQVVATAGDLPSARDPSFVLSRLLFHMAQLPQQ